MPDEPNNRILFIFGGMLIAYIKPLLCVMSLTLSYFCMDKQINS